MRLLLVVFLLSVAGNVSGADLDVLLELKTSLGISTAIPGFESWSPATPPCNFSFVSCDPSTGAITGISLTDLGITGTLPLSSLCTLPSLTRLAFSSNSISGELPADLRNCSRLQHLDLSHNSLAGKIPDLSPLVSLQLLNISDNDFAGNFPWGSLAALHHLRYLSVGDNAFSPSPFPLSILNLTNLAWVFLSDANIHGEIPPAIGNLTQLVNLELADNFLTGDIPLEITKLSKLWQLELYNNSLTGTLPPGLGNLSQLAYFDASINNLQGNLSELRLLHRLVSLQLFYNNFSGVVPPEVGEFRELVNLSLYSNMLSGELPAKLGSWAEFNFIDVSTNMFSGTIPPDMCMKGTMQKLLVLQNNFTGEIPASYGNCTTLTRFRVSDNMLSGEVPGGIWSLPIVNIIDVARNSLHGHVTSGIGEAKSLTQLFMSNNMFSGDLPPEIGGATSLDSIDASYNQFTGEIPGSIGELKVLTKLMLDHNMFTGRIPDTISSCVSLNELTLSANSLSGEIPASLGELPSCNSLDLSNNQISGEVPASLSLLKLSTFNLSFNKLTGAVPAPLSISAYSSSYAGNPGLCAGSSLFLRQCPSGNRRSPGKQTAVAVVVAVATLLAAAVVLAAVGLSVFIRRKVLGLKDGQMGRDSWEVKSFRTLVFDEGEILANILPENLIGKGGSGSVYKVTLRSGKVVAVKQIAHASGGEAETTAMLGRRSASSTAAREFEAEVGTLSGIRHVNVVKLYCAITSEDESLLVYEHLPNGSLWELLHERPQGSLPAKQSQKDPLGWWARMEAALGSARGLEYLHHGCSRPIVHRDVKSSNILLDAELKPRISDFGLAKIVHPDSSSSNLIAGTHGYIAPEYAYTCKVNEKSDVYSYGVVLMELVTGRRPIEAEFGADKDIVHWVSTHITSGRALLGVVDPRIDVSFRVDAVRVLKIAVLCTMKLPAMRPSMRAVVQMLEQIIAVPFVVYVGRKKGADDVDCVGGGYQFKTKENFDSSDIM